MKKSYNPAINIADTTEGLELTKRLYKGATDIARRLDEQKSRSLTTADLFLPTGEALRAKLRYYCERLIFYDFNGHARKTEELLWRKGFYEAFYAAKKLRKGNTWTDMEKALLLSHLSVGIGFYHHLILRLQLEYNLELTGVIDFAYSLKSKGLFYSQDLVKKAKVVSDETKLQVLRLIHRSLICLGDLSRYKLDCDPYWDSTVAIRYYKVAITIDPNIGMPHNQLGTLAGNKNYGLDAVYHYLRCILCTDVFDGAEGNLRRVVTIHSFNGSEESAVHRCVARLLSLLQLWDSEIPDYDSVNQDCEALLNDIENCLVLERPSSVISKNNDEVCDIDTLLMQNKNTETEYLSDTMIFKIVSVCLMFIIKLQNKESSEVQGVIAFTLALLSQILHALVMRLQETFLEMSLSKNGLCMALDFKNNGNCGDEEKKNNNGAEEAIEIKSSENIEKNEVVINGKCSEEVKKSRNKSKILLTKLRRPRRRINSSDSDASDVDGAVAMGSSSDEMNSDISETEEYVLSEVLNGLSDEDLSEDEGRNSEKEKTLIQNEKENSQVSSDEDKNISNKNVQQLPKKPNENIDKSIRQEEEVIVESNGIPRSNTDCIIDGTCDKNSTSKKNFVSSMAGYITQAEMKKLNSTEIINFLIPEGMLASIKICYDWLKSNPGIIKTCAKGSKSLLKRTCILLNLINVDVDALLNDNWEENAELCSTAEQARTSALTVPLPEDIELKGMKIFEEAHKNLDWLILRRHKMTGREETLLRVLKLIKFGEHLCSMQEDTGVTYDENKKNFKITGDMEKDEKEKKILNENGQIINIDHSRGKLMRHMGKLWLKAEVHALESRLRSRFMSPFLVPDHEALIKYMPTLKRLVYAKKFIIVIPTVVVSILDEVKRSSAQAREATRWLETQLKRGSRFLRAQRPHERLPLPLIKGPKPKDKESWLYFQIIECCYYLTQQSKVGDTEIPVVTLLTGCGVDGDKKLAFSSEGLATSAGVSVEHIQVFHTKWKASSKSHG